MGALMPLALAVVGPVGSATLADDLARAIEAHSATRVERIAPERLARCQGSFSCFAGAARPDYDPASASRGRTYAAHARATAESGAPVARLLVVLSVLGEGPDASAAMALIDTDRALAAWHDARRSAEDWEASADARIDAEALFADRRPLPLREAPLVPRALAALEPQLRAMGAWGTPAELEIEAREPGYALSVDGGAAVALGDRAVIRLPAGRHALGFTHPAREAWVVDLELAPGEKRSITLDPPGSGSIARHVAVYGGAAVAAGGAALGITAIALAAASSPRQACLGASAEALERCPEAGRVTFDFSPDAPHDEGGPRMAAVALGLIGFGATTAIATLLDDGGDVSWLAITAGVVVGAAGVVLGSVY